ncbi:MAG: glycosyltransferase, partial [bacterium]
GNMKPILSTSDIGGTERMVLSLIKGMDKAIFQNDVCILDSKGKMSLEFEKETNVYYLNYEKGGILKATLSLFWFLKRNKYDIIHIYGFRANILGRILGRIAGCQRIITGLRSTSIINTQNKLYTTIARFLDKLTFPLVRLCISNSKTACDFLIKNGYPSGKFKVVYNGIDLSSLDFTPDTPLKDRLKDETVIISVANFSIWKNHKTLLNALKIVRENFKFKCLLVGDGPLREELIELTNKLGLSNDVIFLGRKETVESSLSIADIFVLPSIVEGLPVSIMEAGLAHLPIISTNVGGIPELVVDGETGILIKPFDVNGLAKAIEELLVDKEKRKKMGEAGYNRIKNEFSLKKMVKETENIYLDLMK